MRKGWQVAGAAVLLGAATLSVPAQAGDFFSNLFGAFGAWPTRSSTGGSAASARGLRRR
jgi:2-keto-4-pentenoate hydratase